MRQETKRKYEVIRQTFDIERYLEKIKDEDVRTDPDVQRRAGQFTTSMKNELVYTVLTGDHIPDLILGEEENINGTHQMWLIDGLQRTSILDEFRYGNYRVTKDIEKPYVYYERALLDERGGIVRDEQGNSVKELVEFDLRRKTYDDLPKELQKSFNDYQVNLVVHKNCSMERTSQLIRRYNNHTPMNTAQKGFAQIDTHAKYIRRMINTNPFFKDCGKFTHNDNIKGGFERLVIESCVLIFHPLEWKKQMGKMAHYLNENGVVEQFERVNELLLRLVPYADQCDSPAVAELFTSKDSFLWVALFDRFTKLGLPDDKFGRFLSAFVGGLNMQEIDGITWLNITAEGGTKDKAVVEKKLDFLSKLMLNFFGLCTDDDLEIIERPAMVEAGGSSEGKISEQIKKEITDSTTEEINVSCWRGEIIKFLQDNVDADIEEEDVECYLDTLEDLITMVDNNSKLLELANRKSLAAIVAYAYKQELDIDEWFVNLFKSKLSYLASQEDNYIVMQESLKKFNENKSAA